MSTATMDQTLEQIQLQLVSLNEQVGFLRQQAEGNQDRWESIEDLGADLQLVGQSAFEMAVEDLADLDPYVRIDDTVRLLKRLVENTRNLEWALEQLESARDFVADAGPIANYAIAHLTERLDHLDRKGILDFIQEAYRIVDIVLTSFSPQDVRRLGDNIVLILHTVRQMTQPEMLRLMHNLTSSWREAEEHPEELNTSLFGLLRNLNDPQVRRGLALTLRMLKTIAENRQTDLHTHVPGAAVPGDEQKGL